MRRREFIALFGGAAIVWPLVARAQQATARARRIGVLMSGGEGDPAGQTRIAAFRQGLQELGWTEGHNLRVDWRWAGGDVVRTRRYAAELVELAPDLIVANGTTALAALKPATRSIPIVFVIVNDPVGQGFIPSLAHPGGNITGFSFLEFSMVGKLLELLKQVAPGLARVALMFNPETYLYYDVYLRSFEAVSHVLSVAVTSAPIRTEAEIDGAVAKLAVQPGGGLIVAPDPFTFVNREPIIRSAAQHRAPAIYAFREFVNEGGLMSYGPDAADIFRRSASYVDRLLRGANPADLPVQQPTKFELVINLKTAKALGLTIPPALVLRADEVIE